MANIPNAFSQNVVSDDDAEHRVIVRIQGPLVGVLVSIAPEVYGPFVMTNKSGQQILIVECLNAVYGMMVAALLYYKKFAKSLFKEGFKLNPYNRCVANKIVNGKHLTICFHANECNISHVCTTVVDEAIEWLLIEYESIFKYGPGEMKVHRGKYHKYLGMGLDYLHTGKCCVTMYDNLGEILGTIEQAMK